MSVSSTTSDNIEDMVKWRDQDKDLSVLDADQTQGSFYEKYDQSPGPKYLSSSSTGDITFLTEKFKSLKLKGLLNETELSFNKYSTDEESESLISLEESEKDELPLTLQARVSKISDTCVLSPESNVKIRDRRSSVCSRFDPLYETPSSDLSNSNVYNDEDSFKGQVEPSIESIKTLNVGKKFYTEEQVKEILRKHKEAAEEKFLEECRKKAAAREQRAHLEVLEMLKLCQVYKKASEEMLSMTMGLKKQVECLQETNNAKRIETQKVRDEIAKEALSNEELSKSFEELFSRYNQSKSMIKTYQDNKESLVKQLERLKTALEEQEKSIAELEAKQDVMKESSATELAKLKTSEEKERAIINAKFQRSELTIASLENNINNLKIQNAELATLYDELVRKAGKT